MDFFYTYWSIQLPGMHQHYTYVLGLPKKYSDTTTLILSGSEFIALLSSMST